MHLARTQISRKVPIKRKGTKYLARASSHVKDGVPVVIAVRDMLKLAKTAKEVKYMLNRGLIKLNGKKVKDLKEPVRILNVLKADKTYVLSILPTGRYLLEDSKKDSRICKVVDKKVINKNKIQLNLHDGTNFIVDSKDKIKIGDSIELGFDNKMKKAFSLEKGKNIFVISGKNSGLHGKIKSIEGKKALISLEEKNKEVELEIDHIIVR